MTSISKIFDIPYYQLEHHTLRKVLTTKYNGVWQSISFQEYVGQINVVSRRLLRLGVKPNDKIAGISSTNRTEWNIVDIGIL